MSDAYEFTNAWFAINAPVWRNMAADIKPRRVLEIGSFEGQSAVFMIDACARNGAFEITCIDTWAGGMEHNPAVMGEVEARFDRNIARAKAKHAFTLAEGAANSFDVAYIDASHQAPDVLADAVLAFKLTRIGGVMIFDDYLWQLEPHGKQDVLSIPKLGIDAFVNTYLRKLNVTIGPPLRQLYMAKVSD